MAVVREAAGQHTHHAFVHPLLVRLISNTSVCVLLFLTAHIGLFVSRVIRASRADSYMQTRREGFVD